MKRAIVFGAFFLCLSCGLTGCGLFGAEPAIVSTPVSDQAALAARATIDEALQRASAVGAATITPSPPTPPPTPPPTDTATLLPTDTATPDGAATATRLAQEVNAAVAATQSAQAAETAIARQIATAAAQTLTAQAPPTNTPTRRPTSVPTPAPTQTPAALRLAFAYGSVGDSDIGVLDMATGGAWLVADRSCDEAEPGWSPDGRTVFYQADCDGRFDLYRADVDAGVARQLTHSPGQDEREPDVSPDGQWIAYRVNREEDSRNVDGELWVMRSDGEAPQQLGVSGRSPAWSPDGGRLLFMSQRDGGWDVYVYVLDSGDIQRLTDCSVNCRFPAWSPDGQSVIYHETTGQETADAESLWVISADGGRARLLVSGDGPGRAVWSAVGLIAFNSQKGVEVVDEQGRQRAVVLAGDQHWAPAWSR